MASDGEGEVGSTCVVCGGTNTEEVLAIHDVPTLPNQLCSTVEEGLGVERGDITLRCCVECSHMFNSSFDPARLEYDATYENSLHFSDVFQSWITERASWLVADHGLSGGVAAELGCGPGDFLELLCEAGMSQGRGFDPSFDPARLEAVRHPAVEVCADPFPTDGSLVADLVCSRHVLEHLVDPVGLVRASTNALRAGGVVYHEVPNGDLMVRDLALWDLVYEHVSYFTSASLQRLCREAELEIGSVDTGFGDQFLSVVASPRTAPSEDAPAELESIRTFGARATAQIETSREQLRELADRGPVVVWGAGSKGTTYLNVADPDGLVAGVVDVNPRKRGTVVAGTGHVIVDADGTGRNRPRDGPRGQPDLPRRDTRVGGDAVSQGRNHVALVTTVRVASLVQGRRLMLEDRDRTVSRARALEGLVREAQADHHSTAGGR